jgi:hypothetical protein
MIGIGSVAKSKSVAMLIARRCEKRPQERVGLTRTTIEERDVSVCGLRHAFCIQDRRIPNSFDRKALE